MVRFAAILILIVFLAGSAVRAESASLADSLLFYASFDQTANADFARGDLQIYTAASMDRKQIRPGLHSQSVSILPDKGRWGGAMKFGEKTKQVVFYKGEKNLPYSAAGFSGTVSLWLSLEPDVDLEPGYVDPLQITDKTWNNSCLFLDFTKDDDPRHFRLGVFSDYTFWNPNDRKWEDIPAAERPMVDVAQPAFKRGKWTHVAIVFSNFNAGQNCQSQLYLDGQLKGTLAGQQQFTWDTARTAIILGIYYTGLMDEVAIFDRAISPQEVVTLMRSEVRSLKKAES